MKLSTQAKLAIRNGFDRLIEGDSFFVADIESSEIDRVEKLLERCGVITKITQAFPPLDRITFDIEAKNAN